MFAWSTFFLQKLTIYGVITNSVCQKLDQRSLLSLLHGGISFLACSFGISTAAGKYQARMAYEVIKDCLNGAIVYIDDTVIYGRDVEEFLYRVLPQRVAKFNVRLKPSNRFLE